MARLAGFLALIKALYFAVRPGLKRVAAVAMSGPKAAAERMVMRPGVELAV